MFELVISAIGTGLFLNLFLIGPIFFLLLEISLTKSYSAAITLDFGVICADIFYIMIAYYASQEIEEYIKNHPSLYRIPAFMLGGYGILMLLFQNKNQVFNPTLSRTNYFSIFMNGFLLNIANVGIIVFWISIVLLIRTQFGYSNFVFFLFVFVIFITFIIIDSCKIFLAQIFKKKLTDNIIKNLKKITGIILVMFSIMFFLKSFKIKFIENINNKIEKYIKFKIKN